MRVETKAPEHTIIEADDTGVTIERKGLRNLLMMAQLRKRNLKRRKSNYLVYKKEPVTVIVRALIKRLKRTLVYQKGGE